MIGSPSLANIGPAIVKAQGQFRTIGKDGQNPDVRSRYATHDHIIEIIRPILCENGLAVVQSSEEGGDTNNLVVFTRLIHLSGEWIEGTVVVPLVGRMLRGGERAAPDPQSGGSSLSYGRRYGICALLNLATGDDDDGVAASKATTKVAASGSPDEDPYTGAVRSGFAGPSYDYPIPFGDDKGKRLGDIPTPGLKRLQKWIRDSEHTDRKAKFAELDKALTDVLASRALGTDVDSTIARMQAAEDKAADNLPF